MGATLTIEKVKLVGKTQKNGWLTLSVMAYDGTSGVLTPAAVPPIRVERDKVDRALQPWAHAFSGDGLLVYQWPENPGAIGYIIIGTLTLTQAGAMKVMHAAVDAATQLSALGGPVAGGVAGAASVLMKAAVDAAGQGRIVGTIMGSEVDRDDLGTDWKREDRNDHLVATLAYNDHD